VAANCVSKLRKEVTLPSPDSVDGDSTEQVNAQIYKQTNKQTTKLLTRTHSSFKTVKKSGGGSTHYCVLGDETVKIGRYVENIKTNLMPPPSGQTLLAL
jgi:hypothetical protein